MSLSIESRKTSNTFVIILDEYVMDHEIAKGFIRILNLILVFILIKN